MRLSILLRSTRARRHVLWALAAGGALLVPASDAHAQTDVQRALPNVLLLLDNSGSMERMIDGSLPEANVGGAANACNPGVASIPNRWGVALQALTGDILPYYSCYAQPRDGTVPPAPNGASGYTHAIPFTTEYSIGGKLPYDASYFLNFHRPLFQGTNTNKFCTYGPNKLPGAASGGSGVGNWSPNGYASGSLGGAATDFPSDAIWFGAIGSRDAAAVCDPSTVQRTNGMLDGVAYDTMRFGFMTFDSDISPGTGVVGTPLVVNGTAPFTGMWSYFSGWDTGGTPAQGNPPNCTIGPFEVGARNPAAPPWEGRFIRFPSVTADTPALEAQNDSIQKVINSLRPYGATPIAGLLTDAKYYFWTDPNGPNAPAANPSYDALASQGCRNQYIILLTDGAPNLDLRNGGGTGTCASGNGVCPYDLPENVSYALANGTPKVLTYVVGFATSSINDNGTIVQCQNLVTNNQLAAVCSQNPVPSNYQACCTLDKIAFNGGTGSAYFADTPGALTLALSDIIAKIGKSTTTRTTPSFSPLIQAANYDPSAGVSSPPSSSVYLSAFYPNVGRPWSGDIQRETTACQTSGNTFTLSSPTVSISSGDDFAANVNSHQGNPRHFLAVYPGGGTQAIGAYNDATTTMRPYITGTPADGIGAYVGGSSFGATQYGGDIAAIRTSVKSDALGLPNGSSWGAVTAPSACRSTTPGVYLSVSDCDALAWDFLFGAQSTSGLRTQPPSQPPLGADANGFMPFQSRYCTSGCSTTTPNVSALGAIYHATPSVVAAPSSAARDESYRVFASTAPYSTRQSVVYSATTDGLLHAFWADVTQNVNNELWAFVPPAVMPSILSTYPASPTVLLDGTPVVKDVVWDRFTSSQGSAPAAVNPHDWHTMLVAAYGPQARGYYALDVSNPSNASIGSTSYSPAPAGPVFRWSLTNTGYDSNNKPYLNIFGQHGATPTLATIYADVSGQNKTPHEIGVAILPGGRDSDPTTNGKAGESGCDRAYTAYSTYGTLPSVLVNASDNKTYTPRSKVRCWGANKVTADPVVGRSVSIVRLDTGEIIRVFARKQDYNTSGSTLPPVNPSLVSRIIDTPFDSPMTGTPVAYPNQVGAIATKVFLGDADGTVWRIDLSDTNPNNWKADLFLDTVNASLTDYDTNTAWYMGQPLPLAPVVSLDRSGQVVLSIATGDQDVYTASGVNYVYSMTEKLDGVSQSLKPSVNWFVELGTWKNPTGERVSGPMTVFDGALYFATFKPTQSANASCTIGTPYLWGMDFVTPKDPSTPSNGGIPIMTGGGTCTGGASFPCQTVDPNNPGEIIPGVTINQTPACGALGAPGFDQYVGGSQHEAVGGVMGSQFSLYFQRGNNSASSGGALSNPSSISLKPPRTPTVVDSWAAIVE